MSLIANWNNVTATQSKARQWKEDRKISPRRSPPFVQIGLWPEQTISGINSNNVPHRSIGQNWANPALL